MDLTLDSTCTVMTAGEDDWAIINNNGIFGIYNNTATDYALSISETVNTVIINSGNIQLNWYR